MKSFDSKMNIGPDKITEIGHKNICPEFWQNWLPVCLNEKCFPSLREMSAVCCIFKNVHRHSFSLQYRPFSFLSTIGKNFEVIIIESVVDRHNFRDNKQCGFRSGRSTGLLSKVLDNKRFTIDFDKSKLCQRGFLHKLSGYRISGWVIFFSYQNLASRYVHEGC